MVAFALMAAPAAARAVPPANDDFATPTILTGPQQTVTGSTVGATVGPGEDLYGGGAVWFRHTPAQTGWVEISVCTASDAELSVYTGSAPTALTWVEVEWHYGE